MVFNTLSLVCVERKKLLACNKKFPAGKRKHSAHEMFYVTCQQSFRVSIIKKQSITRIRMVGYATNHELNVANPPIF